MTQPTNALQVPSFRALWLNSLTFYLVANALRFVYGWVVLDGLEKSEAWQGGVIFILGLPLLFLLLPAGVWADRLDPKRMLMGSQIAFLVVMAGTALFMGSGAGSLTLIIVSALAAGVVTSVGSPVRSALIPALLGGDLLYSGIALNAIALTMSLVLGAVSARAFGEWFGFDGAFWWLAALTALGVVFLTRLKSPGPATKGDKATLSEAVGQGLRYVWNEAGIRVLFVLLAVSGLMMTPVMFVTLQAHIKEDLGRTAADAAPMLALMGIGIALSSVYIMRKGSMEDKSVKFMRAMLVGTTTMFLMGRTTECWQVLVLALIMGMCGGFFINMNQGLIQSNTPQDKMGRVMGLYALVSGGLHPVWSSWLGFSVQGHRHGKRHQHRVGGRVRHCDADLREQQGDPGNQLALLAASPARRRTSNALITRFLPAAKHQLIRDERCPRSGFDAACRTQRPPEPRSPRTYFGCLRWPLLWC